ncbi:MAG TPA: hypothetical protein VLA92_01740 [Candidatus Saccharimonadales bacterium]|nr:hypothetical protein [Candidatus Saccharimonadales bacterium]
MEKQTTSNKQPLTPIAHLVLFGVSLGLSYAAASHAVETGSLLEYAAGFVLFGLAIKNLVQAFQKRKSEDK